MPSALGSFTSAPTENIPTPGHELDLYPSYVNSKSNNRTATAVTEQMLGKHLLKEWQILKPNQLVFCPLQKRNLAVQQHLFHRACDLNGMQ